MGKWLIFNAASILTLLVWHTDVNGQDSAENARKIYFMRTKQFYGSGAKMNLMINGNLLHKVGNGERLTLNTNSNDTVSIQVIYPLSKSHKSKVLQIPPNGEKEVYVDLFYWGEGYHPFKHAGLANPSGGRPDFNIEVIAMEKKEGHHKFNQGENFKDKKKILEKDLLK